MKANLKKKSVLSKGTLQRKTSCIKNSRSMIPQIPSLALNTTPYLAKSNSVPTDIPLILWPIKGLLKIGLNSNQARKRKNNDMSLKNPSLRT